MCVAQRRLAQSDAGAGRRGAPASSAMRDSAVAPSLVRRSCMVSPRSHCSAKPGSPNSSRAACARLGASQRPPGSNSGCGARGLAAAAARGDGGGASGPRPSAGSGRRGAPTNARAVPGGETARAAGAGSAAAMSATLSRAAAAAIAGSDVGAGRSGEPRWGPCAASGPGGAPAWPGVCPPCGHSACRHAGAAGAVAPPALAAPAALADASAAGGGGGGARRLSRFSVSKRPSSAE